MIWKNMLTGHRKCIFTEVEVTEQTVVCTNVP